MIRRLRLRRLSSLRSGMAWTYRVGTTVRKSDRRSVRSASPDIRAMKELSPLTAVSALIRT